MQSFNYKTNFMLFQLYLEKEKRKEKRENSFRVEVTRSPLTSHD
jgi:hypothetical protein